MKAITLTTAGTASALLLEEVAKPELINSNQVLLRIKAAGINPIDTKIRQSPERFPVQLPAILGCDGAGIIEETGSAVTDFQVGDEVYFCQPPFHNRQGSYAEFTVVEESLLAHKPKSLSFVEAAAVPLVLITAWESLYERARLSRGDTVLIHAGAGGVGHQAIQLARQKGAKVITTVSTMEKAIIAEAMGANKTIIYKEKDFVEEVKRWTKGEGVDLVLDTVGGELTKQSLACIKLYGDLVTILQVPADLDWGLARKKNIRICQELMLSPTLLNNDKAMARQGQILKKAQPLFDSEKLRIQVDKTFTLAEVAEAHCYLEEAHPAGKVVLTMD